MTGGFRAALGGWLKGITVSVGHLSRPFIVSMRNTFRRKGRLMLTLFTLTLGGAIFIAVLNAQVALERKVERLGEYFLADVNLDFAIPYRIEQIKREALAMPGVESVEVWTSTSAEFQIDGVPARNITILALPADSRLVSPVLLQGRWLLPDDAKAITVNDAFWGDYPDLGVGDTLRLKIAGDEDDWTIVGIFQYTGMDDLFAYANYNQVAQLLGASRHASMYRVVTTDHSLAFQQRVSEQLDSHFRTLGYRVSKVEAGNSFAASVTGILGILTAVLVIMALLTALVGSIGLAGTMSMNVLERTREIGVLRAIGAHNGIVFKLVLSEGVLIGLISYVLGAALSFPITNLLSNVISESIFNSPADPAFTVQGFVSWLAVVLVLSVLASIIPARNATRLTIREVLAYE